MIDSLRFVLVRISGSVRQGVYALMRAEDPCILRQSGEKRGVRLDLSEVRKEIDRVDAGIRELFLERMQLAEQVVRVKAETGDGIYKPDREGTIILKQTGGMDPAVVREYTAFIKKVMEVSRMYQYGRMLELTDCFPFAFTRRKKKMRRFCVLNEDLCFCSGIQDGELVAAHSYEDMAEAIKKGLADAGMAVVEDTGGSSFEELQQLLLHKNMYITESVSLAEEKEAAAKVPCRRLTFSDTLEVLPEHNRLRLMVACPEKKDGMASLFSMIADYGVEITDLQLCRDIGSRTPERRFFAELSVNMDLAEGRALLYQLSQEAGALRILGSYRCEEAE